MPPTPLSGLAFNSEGPHPHNQRWWELELPVVNLHLTGLDTRYSLPRRMTSGYPGLRWHLGKWREDANNTEMKSLHAWPARRGTANPDLETRWTQRKAIPRAMGGVAKYKSGLTGPIRVSRNPFPNQTHATHLLSQTCLGQATIRCPRWNQLLCLRDLRVASVAPRPDPRDNPVDKAEELAMEPLGTVHPSSLVIRRRKS